MANLGAVMFRGRSGETYRFQVWPVGAKFRPLGAVCIFSKRVFRNRNFTTAASHECIHIGETADLSTLVYRESYLGDADCICVYLVPDAERRAAVERDLAESLGIWNARFRVGLLNEDAAQVPPAPSTVQETARQPGE
jgi:hypothetical protein